jgi:Zn-dependent metalloprotease
VCFIHSLLLGTTLQSIVPAIFTTRGAAATFACSSNLHQPETLNNTQGELNEKVHLRRPRDLTRASLRPHFAASRRLAQRDKSADKLSRAKEVALNVIAERAAKRGIADKRELKIKQAFADEQQKTHTRFQQTHKGVPVFGGEAIVHLNSDDSVFAVTDDLVEFVQVDTQPQRTPGEAVDTAINTLGCADCLTAPPAADLQILRRDGNDHLTYRVQLRREDGTEHTSMPVYFVDAHTGNVVWNYDNLQTATGVSLYSGSVTINTYYKSPSYYMEDISRKIGTFDNRNTTASTYRFTDADNYWDSASQKAASMPTTAR